jgi:diadenosine tetraphosphate (Ap4A) HIT family hydrolase
MADYSKYLIKEYSHWNVYVKTNQSCLGRCVIWCKREGAEDLAEMTGEESSELLRVIKELREASLRAFNPDWFNYSFLGNETKHLHGHFIPRYKEPREFMGLTFEDKRYGHNYRTDPDFVTPEEIIQGVKEAYKTAYLLDISAEPEISPR